MLDVKSQSPAFNTDKYFQLFDLLRDWMTEWLSDGSDM